MAEKGRRDAGKSNFQADESVVVASVISAITTGCETSVLTRDRDIIEQFYKLMYLVDTHYQGYQIGEAYRRQPLNFVEAPWPKGSEYFDNHFHTGRILWLPASSDERLLPEQYRFVMVHAYRFSPSTQNDSLQTLAFCAEREMGQMIRAKGATRGKSTDGFGLSNIHRCINPYDQETFGSFAAVTVDRGVEISNIFIPWVDIEIVMSRKEQIRRLSHRGTPGYWRIQRGVSDRDPVVAAAVRSSPCLDAMP